jgi:DNA-binding HxlR family transcriptional regulator
MGVDNSSAIHVDQRFSRDEVRVATFKRTAGLLGGKWHVAILYQLSGSDGMRFSALQEEIEGISAKMLSESLDRLEKRYGVVERRILTDKPLRVEYSLSETGESIEPMLSTIAEWASDHQSLIATWDGED